MHGIYCWDIFNVRLQNPFQKTFYYNRTVRIFYTDGVNRN